MVNSQRTAAPVFVGVAFATACFFEQQGFCSGSPDSLSASATSGAGGVTPCSRAQATREPGEKQQQLVQQSLAVTQPHARFWQGNGCERTLADTHGNGNPMTTMN